MQEKISAIVLAGGRGSRMKSDVPKQYINVSGYPVLYYSIKEFENCEEIDEIVLVTGAKDLNYCREEIIEKYNFKKVCAVVAGGKERYNSVYNGLCALKDTSYVLIHDGARPMVTKEIIYRNIEMVKKFKACVTAVPSKDTVKIVDVDGIVESTPCRANVWMIQTPQTFEFKLLKNAYDILMKNESKYSVTDDAMVVETILEHPIKVVEGEYTNIKITTPEDLYSLQYFVSEKANCRNI